LTTAGLCLSHLHDNCLKTTKPQWNTGRTLRYTQHTCHCINFL